MKLPIILGPVSPTDNSLKGLIYLIKSKYLITNPIEEGIVFASAEGTQNGNSLTFLNNI